MIQVQIRVNERGTQNELQSGRPGGRGRGRGGRWMCSVWQLCNQGLTLNLPGWKAFPSHHAGPSHAEQGLFVEVPDHVQPSPNADHVVILMRIQMPMSSHESQRKKGAQLRQSVRVALHLHLNMKNALFLLLLHCIALYVIAAHDTWDYTCVYNMLRCENR